MQLYNDSIRSEVVHYLANNEPDNTRPLYKGTFEQAIMFNADGSERVRRVYPTRREAAEQYEAAVLATGLTHEQLEINLKRGQLGNDGRNDPKPEELV